MIVVSTAVAAGTLTALSTLLSRPEQERAQAFRQDDDRRRFIVAYATARAVLADCLGEQPSRLGFTRSRHGKPALIGAALPFNLAHSGDLVALAVGRDAPVGIDVAAERAFEPLPLSRNLFAPSEIAQIGGDRRAFYRLWTAKEAVAKAAGGGLRLFGRFAVPPPRPYWRPIECRVADPDLTGLAVTGLGLGRGYQAAISTRAPAGPVALDRLDGPALLDRATGQS